MNQQSSHMIRAIAMASIGGGLEMYDFVIYAFFAPILAHLFFPVGNDLAALLAVFVVFAVGYFARPIGAIIFGYFGDTIGRKRVLVVTISLMAAATTLIGVLPTYQMIGIAAPILLVVLRLLQGIAVGGDLPGAITFVAEHVSANRRGLHCGWVYTAVNIGIMVASGISALITTTLTPLQQQHWGWRLAFLLGLVLGIVGYYMRRKISEPELFAAVLAERRTLPMPLVWILKHELKSFAQALGVICLVSVIVGQVLFMPTFLHIVVHLTLQKALAFNTLAVLVWSLCILLMGYFSDLWGRKVILSIGAFLILILAYPLYQLMISGQINGLFCGLLGFAVLNACIVGPFSSAISELFSTATRNSGVGITYNISFAVLCGLTPAIMTILIQHYGSAAPSYWVMLAALVTLLTTLTLTETARKPLKS